MFIVNETQNGFGGEPQPETDEKYIEIIVHYGWELIFVNKLGHGFKSYMFRKHGWSKLLCFHVESDDRYLYLFDQNKEQKLNDINFREFLEINS